MYTDKETTRICLVGAGPRGISVVERLCANAPLPRWRGQRFAVHLVDPRADDGGHVWRTSQRAELLMNTVASQITMFADDSVECEGPVVPGPSLYEWAASLPGDGTGSREVAVSPVRALAPEIREEAKALGPDSYPTRRLYGHYLRWVLDRLRRTAPPNVTLTVHLATATALRDGPGGTQVAVLDDGTELPCLDAVVLAQGHVPMGLTPQEEGFDRFARRHGLLYYPPGNPADADYDKIAPGQAVGVVGMGLTFFDVVALLTTGRGGTFERRGGRLVYRPSGREPLLYAGSRRGVPYHARGENEKGVSGRHEPLFLTPAVIEELRARHSGGAPLSFRRDLWPLVSREVRAVYYHALITREGGPAVAAAFLAEFVALTAGAASVADADVNADVNADPGEPALLDRYGVPPGSRWDWDLIERPYGTRRFTDSRDFGAWLAAHLRRDVEEAFLGNVSSPLKAALDVLRDLRNEIRLVVDHSGIRGTSYRDELRSWYTPLNAYLSIGPPARRIEELIALLEAGVVRVPGPGVRVGTDGDGEGFVVRSTEIPGAPVRVGALIEARLPEVDIRCTTDPLLRHLLSTGQCLPYRIPDGDGTSYGTGGMTIARRPYHLVDSAHRPHPRRFAFGIPTEAVHWVTAAGIRPGVNSVILSDSDAIARACLAAAEARLAALRARGTPYRHVPLAWLPTSGRLVPAHTVRGAS
ncbi:FAD/NAD(P)-binding protein [Streptomyces sp. SID1121]|uniref:FAD/NAD(P)-binding protein n=1 Tax=Streptomyces sp. SID1121 TaxID=3425888 RepID=UPI004055AD54